MFSFFIWWRMVERKTSFSHVFSSEYTFFINNLFLTLAPKTVQAFLKNRPNKLFSNCLADGLLTSIV